ncbi:MAG: ABC transporter substrate-binding protein [Clostridiaceae bacterium]|nr:ABC transporter substrate-binding protein [Clostridiaceae bacterium]
MMKKAKKAAVLALAAAMILSACGSGQTSGGGSTAQTEKSASKGAGKDSINIEISSDPSVLCGGFAANSTVNLVSDQVFDRLLESNGDGTFTPKLAEKWEYDENGRDIIFTLRDGIKFHNGETMTADDVVFSFNTIINGAYATTATSPMERMEKVDDNHVKLVFKLVYGPALEAAATSYMCVFPQAYYEQDPDGFLRNPIGTGAYKFVEWVSGDHIALTRNDDYFDGIPSIKDVTYKVYLDSSVAAIALENGEIDVLTNPTQTDRSNLMNHEGIVYKETESAMVTWAFFNCEGRFSDQRLREAFHYAIDREAVLQGAAEGVGKVANSMFPNFLPGSDPDYQISHPYNPEKAKELLAEAGYGDGMEITVKTRESANYYRPMEIMQAQLAQVGVTMNIERMESNAWSNDVLRRSDFEFNLIATTLGFPDFDERYALVVSGQPQNFYHIADPELDAAFETNRSSTDQEERIQACHDMIRIMDEHCLILPLFANMRGIAYQEGLEGIEPNPYYSYKIDQWSWNSKDGQ